jgi:hypothetical protein
LREGGIHRREAGKDFASRLASVAWKNGGKPSSIRAQTAGRFASVIASKMIRWVLVAQALGAVQLLAAGDELAARVIILANSREPDSVQLAQFYAEKRGVPRANILALPLPDAESITWREFIDRIYRPLQDELYHRGWIDGTASCFLSRGLSRRAAAHQQ